MERLARRVLDDEVFFAAKTAMCLSRFQPGGALAFLLQACTVVRSRS